MSSFTQDSFDGGMDLLSNDTEIAPNAYRYLINGRPRFGSIEPIKDSLELASAPFGKKQGIVAVGNILVAFIAGKAYYKLLSSDSWVKIVDFTMDSNVEYIYFCAVPSSSLNNRRVLNADSNIFGSVSLDQNFAISGTPQGLLCQDGINQAWVIFYDPATNSARARVTKNYTDWNNDSTGGADDREYVPIGTVMYYWANKGILLLLALDGFTILRSVSGRALDFMINIDKDGNKLATESLGGANSSSFSCGTQRVNGINILDNDHILVGTYINQYAVSVDTSKPTIWGEPQFATPFYANVGVVNHVSFADNLGDKVLVDYEGIKSTNGVLNFKFVGRNDPFSLMISKLLVDPITNLPIRQSICAVCNFNNYVIASLNTRLGYALVIYDNLKSAEQQSAGGLSIGVPPARGNWVSIDITACTRVKQFAITNDETKSFLFAITEGNKIFQIFGETETATSILRTKSFTNADAKVKHKSIALRAILELGTDTGNIAVEEIVDEKRGLTDRRVINGVTCGVKPPIFPPVTPDTNKLLQNITFGNIHDGEEGYKLAYILRWDTSAKLTFIQADTSGITTHISKEQITQNLSELMTTV